MRPHVDAVMAGEYALPLKEHPKSVLDIGANVGAFSAWARMEWPEASITAYEPVPDNAKQAEKNLQDLNVRLFHVGLRAKAGTGTLWLGENNCGEASFVLKQNAGQIKAHFTAAHSCPSAEFVKIDTEGCELEILQNLDLSLTKAVSLEAHSQEDASRITGFLNAKGFLLHSRQIGPNEVLRFARAGVLKTRQRAFLAVPIYGGVNPWFMQSLLAVKDKPLGDWVLRVLPGDSLVSRARNTLSAQFLETDCTELVFWDSDVLASPEHIARLLSHNVDVVGGFYPKKDSKGPAQLVCNQLPGTKPRKNGLHEVRYMGTGFLRIRRNVFDQMIEAFGKEIRYHPDHSKWRTEFDFWKVGVHGPSKRYLSEDWFFCENWRALGGKVYGDTRIVLKHMEGGTAYPLPNQEEEMFKQ